MTSDSASPFYCLSRMAVRLAATALGLVLSLSSAAQDTNPGDCAVNGNNDNESCPIGTAPASTLDWVPVDAVPEDERDRRCINCSGRYVDPLASEDTSIPPEESDIRARANSSQMEDDEIILDGGAKAIQGYRHMHGDNVVFNREEDSATISGNVTLREPGVLLLGDSAQIFSKTGEATVYNGEFLFHQKHMRGTANTLQRDTEGLIHVHNGLFTYCAPGEYDWAVHADTMEVDLDEGLATAHDARLDVEGIPVFYTPWLRFPLDDRRRTGFLWPDFGNDSTGGIDITVPFYFNLAPNYDALYSPRYIEERGLNNELVLRYLNPVIGQWTLGGAYMTDDEKYEDDAPEERSHDRWLWALKQNGLFQQRWRSRIDYSKASDVDYMKDLETSSIDSQRKTALLQLGSLDYLGDSWLVNLQVQQFQSLADDIRDDYKKLPQLDARYWGRGTPFSLEPILQAQYSNFDTDENRVTGQRLYSEAGITYPMLWTFGFLRPTVKYRYINYDLSDGVFFEDDTPSTGAPLANLDGGLYFDRSTSFAGRSLLQTLEPRVYYLYSEYDEQTDQPDFDSAELTFTYNQLFRETRFSGRDRIDDANQVSLGLTSRFIDDTTGNSLLSASIGQIFYFRDRKVRLRPIDEALDDSGSEIAGELNFNPNRKVSLRTSLVYDPYDGNMNSGHFLTSYKADGGGIFNVGYSYRRPLTTLVEQPPTEEASVSSYLPVGNNWSVFAAMNYSMEADTSVEDMVGIEYDSCCWTVRLLHLRYYNNVSNQFAIINDPDLEREETTQFQVILKGMGGYGDQITDIMKDMIRGFEEHDY